MRAVQDALDEFLGMQHFDPVEVPARLVNHTAAARHVEPSRRFRDEHVVAIDGENPARGVIRDAVLSHTERDAAVRGDCPVLLGRNVAGWALGQAFDSKAFVRLEPVALGSADQIAFNRLQVPAAARIAMRAS